MATAKTRRDYGSGSITQAKDRNGKPIKNRWIVQGYVINPDTKEQKHFYKRVRGLKNDARMVLNETIANPTSCFEMPPENVPETFSAYSAEWLNRLRVMVAANALKESTFKSYESHVRTLCLHLGNMPLTRINARAINKAFDAIRCEKSEKLGHQVSESTMHRHFVTLIVFIG